MRRLALITALATIGCYRPSARDCVVRCGEGGSCPGGAVCSNGLCTAGQACAAPSTALTCRACAAKDLSSTRCRGNAVLRCGADGWSEETICTGDAPVCLQGGCAQCSPGSKRCRAGCFETCGASGSWEPPASCAACPATTGRSLTTGWSHVCALLEAGVICWGGNDHGQLGLGHRDTLGDFPGELPAELAPVPIGREARVTDLAAGGRHTCALLETGQVKCWGDNGSGQLGLGDTNHRGDQAGEMDDALPPVDLGANSTAISIAAGGSHTCAVLDDGRVKCWGGNGQAQLGLGDTTARGDDPCEMGDDLPAVNLGGARATAVVAGSSHTCALLEDGTVRCWGWNGGGQLGLGDKVQRSLPGAVDFVEGSPAVPEKITALAAGHAHTCAGFEGGALRCWGYNSAGQLGTGETADVTNPMLVGNVSVGTAVAGIAAGNSHTCVVTGGGRVKCWGLANFGQLGLGSRDNRGDDGETVDMVPEVDVGTRDGTLPLLSKALVAGGDHTCALLETGRVKCWGENAFGELGLGDKYHRGDDPDEMGGDLAEVPLPGEVVAP